MTRGTLRPLAILVAALVTLAVIAVASAGISNTDENNPSSRSAGKLGTLALYTWLQDLGLQVHRISGTFDVSGTDMLVVYDPTVAMSNSDVANVVGLLKRGGDAVIVSDVPTVSTVEPLLDAIGVQPGGQLDTGHATPAQLFDSTGRTQSVPFGAGYSFAPEPSLIPLLLLDGDAAAGVIRVGGAGRAYVIGSSLPFSNDGLRHDDSAYFVLSLLQRARGGRIAFDEYHHGEGSQTPAGAAAIFNGPVGLAAVLLAAVVLTVLAVNGRRLGKPVPAGDAGAIPSASGYVAAMGHLFARTRQRGAVAARYADELKRRVGGATGIEAHLDDAAFVARVRASDPGERSERLQALLARLRHLQRSQPDESQLLRAARDVDALEHEWLQGAQLRP